MTETEKRSTVTQTRAVLVKPENWGKTNASYFIGIVSNLHVQ